MQRGSRVPCLMAPAPAHPHAQKRLRWLPPVNKSMSRSLPRHDLKQEYSVRSTREAKPKAFLTLPCSSRPLLSFLSLPFSWCPLLGWPRHMTLFPLNTSSPIKKLTIVLAVISLALMRCSDFYVGNANIARVWIWGIKFERFAGPERPMRKIHLEFEFGNHLECFAGTKPSAMQTHLEIIWKHLMSCPLQIIWKSVEAHWQSLGIASNC